MKGLEQYIKGFHFHFNTNNFSINNYEKILEELYKFTNNKNISLKYLDIGGGLPGANEFIYHDEIFNKLPELIFKYFPQTYILGEPGRYIIGNGVSLKSTVISKNMENNRYKVNIDTNIMHFPCYFEKKYNIEYNTKQNNLENTVSNIEIFGNSCMQIDKIGDVIIKGKPNIGDEIIINNIGAYSFSQASNFISLIPNFEIYE